MTLDSRFRDAVEETLHSQVDVDARLGDLRRTRRHRIAERTGVALVAVALVATAGVALDRSPASTPEPAPAPAPLHGGAVLALSPDGTVTQVSGRALPHTVDTATPTGPFLITHDGTSFVYAADGGVHRLDLRTGLAERIGDCPDGSCAVAYDQEAAQSAVADGTDIVVRDLGTGETARLAIGAPATRIAWSPGGNVVSYVTQRGANATLEYVDVGSGEITRLVRLQAGDSFAATPVWDPGGHQIALVTHEAPTGRSGLLQLSTVTTVGDPLRTDVHALDRCVCVDYSGGLVWSPDSNRIAVTGAVRGGTAGNVYTVVRDGTRWRKLATGDFNGLAWQPAVTAP